MSFEYMFVNEYMTLVKQNKNVSLPYSDYCLNINTREFLKDDKRCKFMRIEFTCSRIYIKQKLRIVKYSIIIRSDDGKNRVSSRTSEMHRFSKDFKIKLSAYIMTCTHRVILSRSLYM